MRCDKIVCLDCYVFTNCMCVNCDVQAYNERYAEKIDKYSPKTKEEKEHMELMVELEDHPIAG